VASDKIVASDSQR